MAEITSLHVYIFLELQSTWEGNQGGGNSSLMPSEGIWKGGGGSEWSTRQPRGWSIGPSSSWCYRLRTGKTLYKKTCIRSSSNAIFYCRCSRRTVRTCQLNCALNGVKKHTRKDQKRGNSNRKGVGQVPESRDLPDAGFLGVCPASLFDEWTLKNIARCPPWSTLSSPYAIKRGDLPPRGLPPLM